MDLEFNTLPVRVTESNHSPTEVVSNKNLGAFYTPLWLAKRVIENSLKLRTKSRTLPTVIDPACGEGVFLCAFIQIIKERFPRVSHSAIAELIFAIDLDPNAVRKSRDNVLQLLLENRSSEEKRKIRATIERNIVEGNALDQSTYPKSIRHLVGSFDLVVGNPPWRIQRSRRDYNDKENSWNFKKKNDEALVAARREWNTGEQSVRQAIDEDLYLSFLRVALLLVDKNGVIGQILPDSFLLNQNSEEIRIKTVLSGRAIVEGFLNSGKAFAADSRKKFVLVSISRSTNNSLEVSFGNKAGRDGPLTRINSLIELSDYDLTTISKTSIIPDLRSEAELAILSIMTQNSNRTVRDIQYITGNAKIDVKTAFIRGSDIQIGFGIFENPELAGFVQNLAIIWRKVSKDDNTRTLLSTVIRNDQITESNSVHKLCEIDKSYAFCIAAISNSILADFFIKTRITVNVTKDIFLSLPLPDLNLTSIQVAGYLYAYHIINVPKGILCKIFTATTIKLADELCSKKRVSWQECLAIIDRNVAESYGINDVLLADLLRNRFSTFMKANTSYSDHILSQIYRSQRAKKKVA